MRAPSVRNFCFVSWSVITSAQRFFDSIREANRPEYPPVQLTPRAQRVLELAQENARRHKRHTPSTADVSIGLLQLGNGVACNILKKFGINEVALQNPTFSKDDSPYTDLLPIAQQEMRPLHHTYLGTEHLLLAILKIENTPLAAALQDVGFTTSAVRDEILRELDPNYEPHAGSKT
jgi:ATP-dependent Clp protease ATP-binding subunit ClpC